VDSGASFDRDAHGLPFVVWYLQQVCANPLAGGKHAVDYLDLHYYPQDPNGSATHIVSDADDSTTAARRLSSLKELYNPAWVSNSWISDLGDDVTWHYTRPNLIPRVRAWIDQYCPGTKLAITEYNWGGDGTASGAVAQAELLGIFAREGVDLAARWVAPAGNSNAERHSPCSSTTTVPAQACAVPARLRPAPTWTRSEPTRFATSAATTSSC
jgi:hypothetical protein